MFEVGQKVWDVLLGEGKVVEVVEYASNYPVVAEFGDIGRKCYTREGKSNKALEKPSLYLYPVEITEKSVRQATKPSINWEHVRKDFKFLAQDIDGNAYLYWEKPVLGSCDGWHSTRGDFAEAHSHVSYVPGTCDWKDSLVARHEGV